MERRAFLPRLALLIGAAAVACREAVTAPFRPAQAKLIVKPDGSWVLGHDGRPLIASGSGSVAVPAGYGPFNGPTGNMQLPDCETYCLKGGQKCGNPECWHCGFNPYTGGCDSLCTC